MLTVRKARPEEIDWVNSRYDEIPFQHSLYDRELIAIAEVDGERAGLGRVIYWDEANAELGGMYVFKEFQGKGVAQAIIQFLIDHRDRKHILYCIPFKHVSTLYHRFGFGPVENIATVSPKVLEKFDWCNAKYENNNFLYVLKET